MKAMGIIFSNIYDSTVRQLTQHRTMASMPFGGRYRQIDFILSNLSHAGIHHIGVITKQNYRSLMDHLGSASDWDLLRKNETLAIIPPFASGNMSDVYKGKMEALYSAVSFIDNPAYDLVVVADATVLCNINLKPALEKHLRSGADVTVVANTEPKDHRRHPLVLRTHRGKVSELLINAPAEKNAYVGMGIFIFSRQMLVDAIHDCYQRGFVQLERDLVQKRFHEGTLKVGLYTFDGVVLRNEDVYTYFLNNMALLRPEIRKGLFKSDRPVYTKVRDESPTFYGEGAAVSNCIVADGCTLHGTVSDSVLFRSVKVEKGAQIANCIVMQGSSIGAGAQLDCVILDKNVTVRPGAVLKGTPEHCVIIGKGETV